VHECFCSPVKVSLNNEKLLSDALKFWREKLCSDISECTKIDDVITQYDFNSEEEVVGWISNLVKLRMYLEPQMFISQQVLLNSLIMLIKFSIVQETT